jgi:hypothetical protein
MKKIYLIIGITLFLFSCNDLLDEQIPFNDLSGENAITNETSAERALNGLYVEFKKTGQFGAAYIADGAIRCGFFDGPGVRVESYKNLLAEFKVTGNISALESSWKSTYITINAANNFIYYLELLDEVSISTDKKNEMLAEAKFIRAFCHLYSMKMFSHFWDTTSKYGPLVRLEQGLLSNNFKARSTVSEGYELILEDFDFVIENGAESSSALKVNTSLAKAYKAETLLMRGATDDYQKVVGLTTDVINNSGYVLEATYNEAFSKGLSSSEVMFARQRDAIVSSGGSMEDFFAENRLTPSLSYVDIMTATIDTRFDIDTLDVGAGNPIIVLPKLYNPSTKYTVQYMRLAQMYLYKAEALYRTQASISEILAPINVLRNRSGNTQYVTADITMFSELNDILFNEFVYELGVENSSIYFASARFTNNGELEANATNKKIRSLSTFFTDDDKLCLPISDDELKLNGLMIDNPK